MAHQVISLDLAAEGTKEEEANAKIAADAFASSAPLQTAPAAYNAGATYAKGATVTDKGVAYRSVVDGNKAHTPHEDNGANWQPFSYTLAPPLVNPEYFHAGSAGAGLGE